jgi:NAD(P)-dependent dehydrogenase (short-subunit alcohol dehydrogenase family)
MHAILDEQLYAYADRVDGKVVLITGAAAGIGRETALLFAKHGAKVVIGDRDVAGAEKVVAEIAQRGGEATYKGCDVCVWDDQVDLFDHAVAKYASVDIVIPNAGVGEVGKFTQVALDSNGRPVQPKLATIQVNLVGLIYTTHLALHYLKVNFPPGSLKAVVMLGSMASWQAVPAANLYTATKHAVLGLMRSLSLKFGRDGIRIGCIHPFFADTAIVPDAFKAYLAGIPKTPVERIACAIMYAATDTDMETSGAAWLLPDNGPVFLVEKEAFKMGVYKMIDARANALLKGVDGVLYLYAIVRDIWRILGKRLLGFSLSLIVIGLAWQNRAMLF